MYFSKLFRSRIGYSNAIKFSQSAIKNFNGSKNIIIQNWKYPLLFSFMATGSCFLVNYYFSNLDLKKQTNLLVDGALADINKSFVTYAKENENAEVKKLKLNNFF